MTEKQHRKTGADFTTQPESVAFLTFDHAPIEHAALIEKFESISFFVKADTIEVLAKNLGFNSPDLKKQ